MAVHHYTEYYWGDVIVEVGKTKTLYIGDDFSYCTSYPSFNSQWNPEDESYVTVDSYQSGRSYVVITGVKETTSPVKIKCQFIYKLDKTATTYEVWHGYYMVNVIPAKPDKITIIDKLTMKLNEKFKFTYNLTPNYAVTTVTWSSDRTNVITIDEQGIAEARTLGTANITAKTANGKSATCKIEVTDANYSIEGPIKQVAMGGFRSWENDYTMLLRTDGTLWACGANSYGQLGDGTTALKTVPVKMMENVKSVSTGFYHTMIVKEDGTLWACGYNYYGQLGDGTTTNRSTPVKIMENVASVSAGNLYTMIIKEDGTLWACGINGDGQLGDGTAIDKSSPVKIMSDVISVSASIGYTMILKKDGSLWACGKNSDGRLGDGTTISQGIPVEVNAHVIAVSAGAYHTMIVKDDGSLWACGYNNVGQLGNGTTNSSTTFVKIMENVDAVSLGWIYSMILKKDGTLWACGYNEYGQLGDGTTIAKSTPVKVMDDVTSVYTSKSVHGPCTMMIKKDGSLWACGNNNCGQLCDGTAISRLLPVKIAEAVNETVLDPNSDTITQGDVNMDNVVSGTDLVALSNIVLGRKEKTMSADVNGDGNVNGTDIVALSNIILGRGSKASRRATLSIQTGEVNHSMILMNDGTLWGSGDNGKGQLGDGTTTSRSTLKKVDDGVAYVAQGYLRTMYVKTDGSLWACGSNIAGQLGDGTTTDRLTPVKVMDNVASVTNGDRHSMILKTNGTLWACGFNGSGQLGDGTTTNRKTPVKVMDNVVSTAAGQTHTLIVKKDGTLWACGNNGSGQLGDGTTTDRKTPVKVMNNVVAVTAGDNHTVILKKDGTLWACGDNSSGELGDGTWTDKATPIKLMDDVASVSAGPLGYHNMIVKNDGSLWACGDNSCGQFGNGTNQTSNKPVKVMDNVTTASAGYAHSLILKKDGTLWACGYNRDGELGDGTTINKAEPIQISEGGAQSDPEPQPTGKGRLSIEPFDIKAGETKEMLIDLTNPNDEVTLVQFDLHLPAGLSIKKSGSDLDFDMAGRTSWRKHTLDANEVDGAYRFLLYSSGNTLIEDTSGAIIKVNIVADESFNGGKIVLDNILLVDPNEKETKPEAYEYVIPTPDDGSAKLSIEPFDIAVGETKEMLIDLSNPNDEVTLVQFDLHLPAGLSIKKSGSDLDFDMAGRTSWRKHTLDANEVDGAYRFLLYSSGNTLIEGASGAIIKVNIVADESFNGGKIVLDNILLVDPNEKETKPARYEYEIGSGSGISTVMMDASGKNTHIYNLSGQKLTAPKKGVNIINGKKIVIR